MEARYPNAYPAPRVAALESPQLTFWQKSACCGSRCGFHRNRARECPGHASAQGATVSPRQGGQPGHVPLVWLQGPGTHLYLAAQGSATLLPSPPPAWNPASFRVSYPLFLGGEVLGWGHHTSLLPDNSHMQASRWPQSSSLSPRASGPPGMDEQGLPVQDHLLFPVHPQCMLSTCPLGQDSTAFKHKPQRGQGWLPGFLGVVSARVLPISGPFGDGRAAPARGLSSTPPSSRARCVTLALTWPEWT